MTSVTGLTCVVCGKTIRLLVAKDHLDEWMCHSCARGPRCDHCGGVLGGSGKRAMHHNADGEGLCHRCHRTAVDGDAALKWAVPPVRKFVHSVGIRLPNRVTVQLISGTDMAKSRGRQCSGYTMISEGFNGARVHSINIRRGMPFTVFGATLAHEMTHGWLRQHVLSTSHEAEEGMCELVASWWLGKRGGPLSAMLLQSMEKRPDPVYGGGYRAVRAACEGMSPPVVVAAVERNGAVPFKSG